MQNILTGLSQLKPRLSILEVSNQHSNLFRQDWLDTWSLPLVIWQNCWMLRSNALYSKQECKWRIIDNGALSLTNGLPVTLLAYCEVVLPSFENKPILLLLYYSVGKMGSGEAEQNCKLCLHTFSCLNCTIQLPGACPASVLSNNHRKASSCLLFSDWSNRGLMEEEENCHLLMTSPRVTKGPW